ncbi:unnamed protein product [Ceutorhynchus assimilis]|uniref:lysozyme n=1 Tax=Ceutorhynchus assimilis TaxID=467358 RepID=A0A9N9MCB6_9CUCU|nr:unnamed protein product [Ceutorhynchus assimilis]
MFAINKLQIIGLVLSLSLISDAKVYSKCEFAKQMRKHGITNRNHLGTWTCIAYHESRFNTKAINHNTGDYGILQISHLYWCSDSNTPGKGCHITCKSLLGEDITEDIVCAKKVYAEHQRLTRNGFNAWTTYKAFCLGDQTKWISGCNLYDLMLSVFFGIDDDNDAVPENVEENYIY